MVERYLKIEKNSIKFEIYNMVEYNGVNFIEKYIYNVVVLKICIDFYEFC